MFISEPFVLWAIIGVASGFVLGLGGSGGGIVAVPLLILLGNFDVGSATSYGLLVGTVGSLLNWFSQRNKTIFSIVLGLVIPAIIFAHLLAPLKPQMPNWSIAALLNLVCLLSLYSLWFVKHKKYGADYTTWWRMRRSLPGGAIAGGLATITGMGGGVVMVPWLVRFARINLDEAIACSLMTIAIIAPFSAWRLGTLDLGAGSFLGLILGVLISIALIQQLLIHMNDRTQEYLRKITLSFVMLFSMTIAITGL